MEKSAGLGMQTFDMALYNLYNDGKISFDEAIKNADGANNLRLKIELAEKGGSISDDAKAESGGEGEKKAVDPLGGLSLVNHADDEEEEEAPAF